MAVLAVLSQHLLTGLPKKIVVTSEQIRDAFIEFLEYGGWGKKKMSYYTKSWANKYNLKRASKYVYYLE